MQVIKRAIPFVVLSQVIFVGLIEASCSSNDDCDSGYYCQKAVGDCDGVGVCEPRPSVCPDLWDPVCGCDGQTYANHCYAAMAGVNVEYAGECVSYCGDNSDCGPDYYCAKTVGDCDGVGVCEQRPTTCPYLWDPVCGCDGQTYANDCLAAAHGVNIEYTGQCISYCEDNSDCGPHYYCAKAVGDCDGVGVCEQRPTVCVDIWDPVCGCNGQTYANYCYAAMAGVNVDYAGQCMPAGAIIQMREPWVVDDDVHTGESGVASLKVLWSEAVIFGATDVEVQDENGLNVGFSVSGSGTTIMTITFVEPLIFDAYEIRIMDSVVSMATGYPIDGDENGAGGGDAVLVLRHRRRVDADNSGRIDLSDLAILANYWLTDCY